MISPKEKALDMCNRFMICNSYQAIVWHNARLCALISVDEIINNDIYFSSLKDSSKYTSYWYEVQEEIKKLKQFV